MTLPEDPTEWQSLLSGLGPLSGPFDWSLSLGPLRAGRRSRLTRLGHLVEAWRQHDYEEARQALARLADELLQRAQAEVGFDLWTELPQGFASGTPFTFAGLVPEFAATELWTLGWASSYETLPAAADVCDRALRLCRPVSGQRVLLTTVVYDRPELASGCVHRLKAEGALWVGMLALASEALHG